MSKKTIATILYLILSISSIVLLFSPFQYVVNNTFTRSLAFFSFFAPIAIYEGLKKFAGKQEKYERKLQKKIALLTSLGLSTLQVNYILSTSMKNIVIDHPELKDVASLVKGN